MSKELIFVYGSLMEGLAAHYLLEQEGVVKVGEGRIHGLLYDLGAFPAAIPGDGKIEGELYLIPENYIRVLDRYEGVREEGFAGSLYHREKVMVRGHEIPGWPPPPEVEAWVYFYAAHERIHDLLLTEANKINDGNWREFLERRGYELR